MKFDVTIRFKIENDLNEDETPAEAGKRIANFYWVNDYVILKDLNNHGAEGEIIVAPVDEAAEIELAPEANGAS